MEYNLILKKEENNIGFLTLNAPEIFNGFSIDMCKEVLHALKAFSEDPKVKVIIISGNGPGFCAGGDLKSMMYYINNGDIVTDYFEPVLNMLAEIAIIIRKMDKPVI